MRLLKIIRLAWTFYRSFLLLSVIITGLCARVFWLYGFTAFFGIFWCKIGTLVLTYFFINTSKRNEYYYYWNSGIDKTLLWATALSFDLALYLFLLILTYHLR